MSVQIKSFVGAHPVTLYSGCEYDAAVRKYRGGIPLCTIPFSGRILSAKIRQSTAQPIPYDGCLVPTATPQVFYDVDDLPPTEECEYCLVSAAYVAACKALDRDTSRLLTIGGVVVDENDRVIGTVNLNRN